MTVARAPVGESLLAVVALVRPDVRVDAYVPRQIGLLDKLLGAVRAAVSGTVVDQHVLFERIPSLMKEKLNEIN